MKFAFAVWNNRIAPVFDAARQVHFVETEQGRIISEREEFLPDDFPVQKAIRLKELGVTILVCGAISRPLHEIITTYGIHIIPFVAGNLYEVIQACIDDCFDGDAFAMPGCHRHRHRWYQRIQYIDKETHSMNGRGQKGQGQGRGGQRFGRMGGPNMAGPSGTCVCPQCGYKEPHERGVPCIERRCPKCGAVMIRE